MTKVEPEEAEAIQEMMREEGEERAAADVAARDFRQPRRISSSLLVKLRRDLSRRIPELEETLASRLRSRHAMEARDLRETSVAGLFNELPENLPMARFRVAGHPAWILWQNKAAHAAIETIFGSTPNEDSEDRAFSKMEAKILDQLMSEVANFVCSSLELQPSEFRVVDRIEDMGHWRDGGAEAEAHRLCVDLVFEGPAMESSFQLYLPGFKSSAQDSPAESLELSDHCNQVTVEVGAFLGSNDLPLNEILELQVGDVIPLGTTVDEPLLLRAEGCVFGTGHVGNYRGNLAVRVIEINPSTEPE